MSKLEVAKNSLDGYDLAKEIEKRELQLSQPLSALNASCNRIESLLLLATLPSYQTLTQLRLDNNLLTNIPALPPNLLLLDVSHNRIQSLEPLYASGTHGSRQQCVSLQFLDASHNLLCEASGIERFPSLKSLRLNDNASIRTMPPSRVTARLAHLQALDVSGCDIRHPADLDSVRSIPELKALIFLGTPLADQASCLYLARMFPGVSVLCCKKSNLNQSTIRTGQSATPDVTPNSSNNFGTQMNNSENGELNSSFLSGDASYSAEWFPHPRNGSHQKSIGSRPEYTPTLSPQTPADSMLSLRTSGFDEHTPPPQHSQRQRTVGTNVDDRWDSRFAQTTAYDGLIDSKTNLRLVRKAKKSARLTAIAMARASGAFEQNATRTITPQSLLQTPPRGIGSCNAAASEPPRSYPQPLDLFAARRRHFTSPATPAPPSQLLQLPRTPHHARASLANQMDLGSMEETLSSTTPSGITPDLGATRRAESFASSKGGEGSFSDSFMEGLTGEMEMLGLLEPPPDAGRRGLLRGGEAQWDVLSSPLSLLLKAVERLEQNVAAIAKAAVPSAGQGGQGGQAGQQPREVLQKASPEDSGTEPLKLGTASMEGPDADGEVPPRPSTEDEQEITALLHDFSRAVAESGGAEKAETAAATRAQVLHLALLAARQLQRLGSKAKEKAREKQQEGAGDVQRLADVALYSVCGTVFPDSVAIHSVHASGAVGAPPGSGQGPPPPAELRAKSASACRAPSLVRQTAAMGTALHTDEWAHLHPLYASSVDCNAVEEEARQLGMSLRRLRVLSLPIIAAAPCVGEHHPAAGAAGEADDRPQVSAVLQVFEALIAEEQNLEADQGDLRGQAHGLQDDCLPGSRQAAAFQELCSITSAALKQKQPLEKLSKPSRELEQSADALGKEAYESNQWSSHEILDASVSTATADNMPERRSFESDVSDIQLKLRSAQEKKRSLEQESLEIETLLRQKLHVGPDSPSSKVLLLAQQLTVP